MTGYTNVTLNFKYVATYLKSGASNLYDRIKVYYKNSSTGSWVQIGSELSGNFTTWQTATTINISDAVLSSDFYIAFEGIDAGAYGVSVDNVVINGSQAAPPAAPALVSPVSGTNTTNKRPAFDWSDSSGATSYTIQVDNNSNFSSPEIQQSPSVSNYTPTADLADGIYYWRVLAVNSFGSSSYTSSWTVNIGSAPAVPALVSPANASTTTNQRPAFDWGDVSGAISYTIQADNNSDFSSPEIQQSPTVSNYTHASDLAYGTYYWRVLSTNTFGSSAYSSSWSIVIQAPPPSAPSLVSPANTSITYDRRPVFDWSDVAEAATYTILVDNNSDFSSPEISQSPALSSYTPASDLAYGTYYWKVRSNNANGSSDFTSAWSVNVQELLIPNITLSVTGISETAAVNANVQNSFNIGNSGNADINFSISTSYSSKKSTVNVSETYFTSDLNGWTNSGQRTWAQTVSANNLDGSPFVSVTGQLSQSRTAILTSPQFDGSVCSALYLDFDHITTLTNASVFDVQYSVNGVDYMTVYSTSSAVGGWSNPNHQRIELPQISATMTIRFSATLGSTSTWSADNIVVSGPETSNFSWLTINSPVSGTVVPTQINTVNYTCDASDLEPGTYNAEISVTSNDPDEPEKIIPVEFIVYQPTIIPGIPSNLVTSIAGTDLVIDWNAAADATSYDVYSSDNPYGEFSFEANVGTNQYVTPYTEAKRFYYIISKNATK